MPETPLACVSETTSLASWDDWIIPIQKYLIVKGLSDREIDEILSHISASRSTERCPLLLDVERNVIESMIPMDQQSVPQRVRRYMIDPVPENIQDVP